MAAKRKTPAKSSEKKSTAKKSTAKKSTGAKSKPSTAKKSTAAKPAPAEQVPAPGEEAPPPAPEGQPPPDTAATGAPSAPAAPTATAEVTTEAAAMEAPATEAPTPGALTPPPPAPKRRNPLVVPFIIVLILLLIALAALSYVIFIRPTSTTNVSTSTSPAAKKAANGTFGKASGSTCSDVSHPEDKAGSLDNAARHGGSDDKPDLVTSNPPTSGIHGGGFASNGSNYTNPQPLGYLVHSMDHGSVVIWHRNMSQDELKDLLDVANSNLRRDYAALVMVPYNDMEPKIALTAWGSSMQCDGVNAEEINDFITEFMATGPEAAAACLDMPEDHPRCS